MNQLRRVHYGVDALSTLNVVCSECRETRSYVNQDGDTVCAWCKRVLWDVGDVYVANLNDPDHNYQREVSERPSKYDTKYHFMQILLQFIMQQKPIPPEYIICTLKDYMLPGVHYSRDYIWSLMDQLGTLTDPDETYPTNVYNRKTGELMHRADDPCVYNLRHYKKKWIVIRYLCTGVKPYPMEYAVVKALRGMFDRISPWWEYCRGENKIWIRLRMVIRAWLHVTGNWREDWDEYFPLIRDKRKLELYGDIIQRMFVLAGVMSTVGT